jgi:hypothetical protein
MRQPFYILIGIALTVGIARTADAVDWQFTGATNRTFVAVRSGTIATEFNSVVPAMRLADVDGEFDSRLPSAIRSDGHNMRSDAAGTMIIFR